METPAPKARSDRAVHEPVPHLKVWVEDKIHILASDSEGKAVELDAVQASLLADLLRLVSEPDFPDVPYKHADTGFDALMHDVCVEWGFCGSIKDGRPLHVSWFIPSYGPVTADQFVEWVFLAEGLNPSANLERWQKYKELMKASFVRNMGGEVVDAKRLRWSDD